ncbi:MAG: Wzz/FepE/Etk N-terminal domain-containing protein, partial [Hyphomicrobiaceae bacterium]
MNDIWDQPPDENRTLAKGPVPIDRAVPAPREPYGPPGGYPASAPDEPGDFTLDLLEYWRIFYKRKWLILSIAAAFVALGTVRTLMQTPLYSATVRIQIDRDAIQVVEGGKVTPTDYPSWGDEFLRTQYERLSSRAVAGRVASRLKLGANDDFFKPRGLSILGAMRGLIEPATDSQAPDAVERERAAAGMILANRGVDPVVGSRMVDITYTDPKPLRAQRIANAYADAFIAANLDKRFQANAYAKTFLEDKIKQLKLRLETSENALVEFAEKEQITAVLDKTSIAENNL